MSENLILSAAIGYKFNQLEFFIKSLRNYYKGTVAFLIGKNDHDLGESLKKFNCELIISSSLIMSIASWKVNSLSLLSEFTLMRTK